MSSYLNLSQVALRYGLQHVALVDEVVRKVFSGEAVVESLKISLQFVAEPLLLPVPEVVLTHPVQDEPEMLRLEAGDLLQVVPQQELDHEEEAYLEGGVF